MSQFVPSHQLPFLSHIPLHDLDCCYAQQCYCQPTITIFLVFFQDRLVSRLLSHSHLPRKYCIDVRLCRIVRQADSNKFPRHCIYLFVITGYYIHAVNNTIMSLTGRFLDGSLERRTCYLHANSE